MQMSVRLLRVKWNPNRTPFCYLCLRIAIKELINSYICCCPVKTMVFLILIYLGLDTIIDDIHDKIGNIKTFCSILYCEFSRCFLVTSVLIKQH